MKFAKRLLMVFGAVMLAGMVGVILTPKAAHALVATLVQVANTSANPVPVTNADEPFAGMCNMPFFEFPGISETCNVSAPAGKRLVIDGASIVVDYTGHVEFLALIYTSGGMQQAFVFPATDGGQSADASSDLFVGNVQLKISVDAGTSIECLATPGANSNPLALTLASAQGLSFPANTSGQCFLSGHLVSP